MGINIIAHFTDGLTNALKLKVTAQDHIANNWERQKVSPLSELHCPHQGLCLEARQCPQFYVYTKVTWETFWSMWGLESHFCDVRGRKETIEEALKGLKVFFFLIF